MAIRLALDNRCRVVYGVRGQRWLGAVYGGRSTTWLSNVRMVAERIINLRCFPELYSTNTNHSGGDFRSLAAISGKVPVAIRRADIHFDAAGAISEFPIQFGQYRNALALVHQASRRLSAFTFKKLKTACGQKEVKRWVKSKLSGRPMAELLREESKNQAAMAGA